jgi:hypothetical protein
MLTLKANDRLWREGDLMVYWPSSGSLLELLSGKLQGCEDLVVCPEVDQSFDVMFPLFRATPHSLEEVRQLIDIRTVQTPPNARLEIESVDRHLDDTDWFPHRPEVPNYIEAEDFRVMEVDCSTTLG